MDMKNNTEFQESIRILRRLRDLGGFDLVDGACTKALSTVLDEPCGPEEDATHAKEWHPIDTAPADGRYLVWLEEPMFGSQIQVAECHSNMRIIAGCSYPTYTSRPTHWMPTHWMPLPLGPSDNAPLKEID